MSFDINNERVSIICPKQIGPYVFRGTMGDGAFSVVKLVLNQNTNNFYACKIVPKKRINTESLRTRFEAEIYINQQLHHPGIVELFDLLKDENNYYIIMEFCPNGELFQYIIDRTRLSENEAKPFIRQILETLQYIHSMNISHRDLKPENLLISQTGMIKFSDFGLSNFIPRSGLLETPCGSPCYASPECISGKPYDGKSTDVWSCGVILYAMTTGQLPWTKRNQTQLFAQIKRGEYEIPNFLSDKCRNFIKGLLTVDISKRLTIEEALNDEWLRSTPVQYVSFFSNQKSPASKQIVPACITLRKVDIFFENDSMSTQEELQIISKNLQLGKPKFKIYKSTSNSFDRSFSSGQFSFKQTSDFLKKTYSTSKFNSPNSAKATSMFDLQKIRFPQEQRGNIPSMSSQTIPKTMSDRNCAQMPQVSFMSNAIHTCSKGGARKYVMASSSMHISSNLNAPTIPKHCQVKRNSITSLPKSPNACLNLSSNLPRPTSVIRRTSFTKPKVMRNNDAV